MISAKEQLEVSLKAHEANQALARFNGECASRAQSWGIAVWSALTAFAFTSSNQLSLYTALVVLVSVFLVDLGYRRIQYRFISKAMSLERVINKYLLSGQLDLPLDAFSTVITSPDGWSARRQLELKRWLFWFPYALIFMANLMLFLVV